MPPGGTLANPLGTQPSPTPQVLSLLEQLRALALANFARTAGVLLLPFVPGNMGPPGTGELNEPIIGAPGYTPPFPASPRPAEVMPDPDPVPEPELVELPELVVMPPRVPPRPTVPVSFDPIQPPNWSDLLDFNTRFPGQPYIPLPGWGGDSLPVGPLRYTDDPVSAPGFVDPLPDLEPELQPQFQPEQTPRPDPAPSPLLPLAWPLPEPGPQIVADPFPSPTARPSPAPGPTPAPIPDIGPAPLNPGDFQIPSDIFRPAPVTPGLPIVAPMLPDLMPDQPASADPQPFRADPCNCPKLTDAPEKKKPKKETPPRSVCYRGTYVQNTRGISYNQLERVPCNPKDRKKSSKKSKPTKRGNEYALPF